MQCLYGYGRVRLREARPASVEMLRDATMNVERHTYVERMVLRAFAGGAAENVNPRPQSDWLQRRI